MTVHKIGATAGTITDLKLLTVPTPYPFQTFHPYSKVVGSGAGGTIGLGWATDEWEWGFLTAAQRNQLKAFCTSASVEIYIQTLDYSIASPAWKVYRAKMLWNTEGEDRQATRSLKTKIVFKLIEDVTPP